MNYYDYNAKSVGLPNKVRPVTTYKRNTRSEFTANQWLHSASQAVRS